MNDLKDFAIAAHGAFSGHALDTPWDKLHLAYFSGDAMWTYLTQPARPNYGSEHRDFDGITVPTKRRVCLIGEDGAVLPEPLVVSIDPDTVRFH